MFIRLVFAVRGGQRLAALSQPVEDVAIFTAVTRAVKAMGFVYTPAIAMCDALAVPAVVGVLRPMLLLPLSIATQLTPEQIKLVAMHELRISGVMITSSIWPNVSSSRFCSFIPQYGHFRAPLATNAKAAVMRWLLLPVRRRMPMHNH